MLRKIKNQERKTINRSYLRDKNTSFLTSDLQKNIQDLKHMVGLSDDIIFRDLTAGDDKKVEGAVVYLSGLVDEKTINLNIIDTFLSDLPAAMAEKANHAKLVEVLEEKVFAKVDTKSVTDWETLLDLLYSGDTLILIEGLDTALIAKTRKWQDRGVEEPTAEQVIRGPKEGFTETLTTNLMLLRRKIKSPKLQFEAMKVGTLTKTDIIIGYIKGIVNPKLVEEVRSRINRIETDGIMESNMLEELIEDSPFAIFPQIHHTERPDKATAHLMEGGITVIIDGTPVVLLLPTTFWQYLHSPEDYYERIYTTILIRGLRLIAFIIALILPAFYVAVTTYHHEMIPISLLEVIVVSRRGVPFPVLVEVIIMEFILEIVREAGVRLPRNVGQAISIVGALVLGQAAIQSKLASPIVVVVVAITAISNFSIPAFSAALSIRYMRFALMIATGILGMFGLISALFVIIVHLSSLRSFGVPFLAPAIPALPGDFKDSLVRLPIWGLSKRARIFGAKDVARQKAHLKPDPQQKDQDPKGDDKDA